MLTPLVLLVFGQVITPPAPLRPANPVAPLQPTPAAPSLAPGGVEYTPPLLTPNGPVERSVLATSGPQFGTVVPASAAPLVPLDAVATPPVTASLAARLVRDAWRLADEGETAGEPVALLSALETATSNAHRRDVVTAYWRLAQAAAEYGWAVDDLRHAQRTAAPSDEPERARWRSHMATTAASERQMKLQLRSAQYRLAGISRLPASDKLPLPLDPPYVGRYETRYAALVAAGMPAELKQIDGLLPEHRELIEQWAQAVTAADEARGAMSQAVQEGGIPLGELFTVSAELRRARLMLAETIYLYNDQIANYAFGVAAEGLPSTTIVSMLIPGEPRTRSVLVSPTGVRQATAIVPADSPAFRELP